MIGQRIAHYSIVEKLGEGGMGEVWKARDTQLDRDVALKVLRTDALGDETARARLVREACFASKLNHPHVCTVHEVGESDGRAYIAMELVEGQSLSARLSDGPLSTEQVLRFGQQVADALAHAHEHGIVHRDLKSANILITPEGRAKVVDFGLAKRLAGQELEETTTATESLTGPGKVVGTLAYMAPEQLRGRPADARSDVWALGIVLYEMVAGGRPFKGQTGFELSSAILNQKPPPLPANALGELRPVIERCLAKEPGERYQRAGEVRAALEAIQSAVLAAVPVPAVQRRQISRRWAWAVVAVVLGLAAAVGVVSDIRERRGERVAMPAGPRLSTGDRVSGNREANEYFERAVLFLLGSSDLPRARQMLEKALALDPRFSAARALYGFTHWRLIDWGYSNDTSWLYKAEEDLRQALRDDPQVQAHGPLAAVYFSQGRKELVLAEVDTALKIKPDDRYALHWLAHYHRLHGNYAEALGLWRKIVEREPLFWPSRMNIGDTLRMMGDTPGAIREQEKILEQSPDNVFAQHYLAIAHLTAGDFATARRRLERVRPEHRQRFLIRMAWALLLALEGKREEALKEMDEELLKWGTADILMTLNVAEFYALLGEPLKALDWLERCVRSGDERAEWFRRDPLLASIRAHPRFRQILESVEYRRQQRGRK